MVDTNFKSPRNVLPQRVLYIEFRNSMSAGPMDTNVVGVLIERIKNQNFEIGSLSIRRMEIGNEDSNEAIGMGFVSIKNLGSFVVDCEKQQSEGAPWTFFGQTVEKVDIKRNRPVLRTIEGKIHGNKLAYGVYDTPLMRTF
jgi:hypothetical protein